MKRLAYLCGSESWGGLEMNHLRNAVWMTERGHKVVLLCWENTPLHLNALTEKIEVITIPFHGKYYEFKKARDLQKLIEKEGITHLLLRSNHDLSIAATIKWRMKKRIHVSYFMEMQFGIKKNSPFHDIRYRYLDLWSCPLNWLTEQVKTMTHISHRKITTILSGIDKKSVVCQLSKEEARENLNLPLEKPIIGLFGRYDNNKGQLLLLEALQYCKAKDFKVLLLGNPTLNESDEYTIRMHDFIEDHQLNDRVILRPFEKRIDRYYKAIDCIVNATQSETVGMTTLEALCNGIPIIGSNAGGTKEILRNGEIGLLFEPLSSADLAGKIDLFFTHQYPCSAERLMKESENFDYNTICAQVEKVLGIQ